MIVFRAAAGSAIGAGHAMRCLAVAEAARADGAEVALAVDDEARATVPRLAASGVPLVGPEPRPCAAVLIDGYAFTAEDERAWAVTGAKVAVFEDAPGRAHACDLLIDPSPGRSEADYRPFAPGAELRLGSAFVPLSAAFAAARPGALAARARPGPLRRVLVSTGLTDAGGLAVSAIAALRDLASIEWIDVAVGAIAASLGALDALAKTDSRIRLHIDTEAMAALTATADLGIGAAGVSSWERCALGLPSVAVVVAENQAHNAAMLAQAGAARIVQADAIADGVVALVDPKARRAMSQAAAAMVDGLGASRIAEALAKLG